MALGLEKKGGGEKGKKKNRRHHPSSFATSICSCAFRKWQDAECFFCLLINISEHYTWNAPATLNIGPVHTPRLFLSDMSSSNAQWKLKKIKAVHQGLPPHPAFFSWNLQENGWKIRGPLWTQVWENEKGMYAMWRQLVGALEGLKAKHSASRIYSACMCSRGTWRQRPRGLPMHKWWWNQPYLGIPTRPSPDLLPQSGTFLGFFY